MTTFSILTVIVILVMLGVFATISLLDLIHIRQSVDEATGRVMGGGIATFNKVSIEQFATDMPDMACDELDAIYDNIKLPTRATTGSAGYDFYSPIDFTLKPNESVTFPTGIRAEIDDGWVLQIYPRSGLGFKYGINLANTVGVIDSDYFWSDNEGHIMIKLVNRGTETVDIKAGDRVAQGIFVPYGITTDDECDGVRNGGFGSSGK